jgi:hypothetical protein
MTDGRNLITNDTERDDPERCLDPAYTPSM